MSRASAFRLSLAGISALLMTSAPITITPASHDFGDVAVGAVSADATFQVSISHPLLGNVLTAALTGNVNDFGLRSSQTIPTSDPTCTPSSQGAVCRVSVEFRPKTLGPLRARLEVTDRVGSRASADLIGKGVAALCLPRVVHCNYAHLWSGIFNWTSVTRAPDQRDSTGVNVRVTKGDAFCRGLVEETSQGTTRVAQIRGPGLIAVELLPDPVYHWVYLITVACPSPDWPEDPSSGTPATPSRPAEMGHEEQSSEKQPATGKRITLEELLSKELSRLQGQITHRDADATTGASGHITITWNLTRS